MKKWWTPWAVFLLIVIVLYTIIDWGKAVNATRFIAMFALCAGIVQICATLWRARHAPSQLITKEEKFFDILFAVMAIWMAINILL